MKSFSRSILGVTLLEVMLVLVIISIIIVMSMRYYSNASAAAQAEVLFGALQNIQTAAEAYAAGAGNGSYTGFSSSNLPANLPTQWGTITLHTSTKLSYQFDITIPMVRYATCMALYNLQMPLFIPFWMMTACPVPGTAGPIIIAYTQNTLQ